MTNMFLEKAATGVKYGTIIKKLIHTLETHMYSLRKKIDDKLQLKDLIIYKEKKGYVLIVNFL